MESKAQFIRMQYFCQLAISLYGVRQSYSAITNLRKYEGTTKKLAKWSKEADRQLWMTRKTQTAGAVTCFIVVISAMVFAFFPSYVSRYMRLGLSGATLVVVMGARHYIKGFWMPTATDKDGKPKGTHIPLPNMEEYNVAVKYTEELVQTLSYLEYSLLGTVLLSTVLQY